MPDGVLAHPEFWTIWSPSPFPEAQGEPYLVGKYRSRVDAEKAADRWPGRTCWIVEPEGSEG